MDDTVYEILEKVNEIITMLEEQPDEKLVVVEELAYQLHGELEQLLVEE